jgi:hypothetical protein
LTSLVRRHWGFTAVFAVGALLRLAAWIAYRPILFFDDSVDYVGMAKQGSPVAFAPSPHPAGYPLLVELFSGGFRSLAALSAVQHLAGLAAGVLVYALLVRLGTPRKLAVVASALVLWDLWLIALEQHLATETFFLLMTTASAYLAVVYRSPGAIAGAGLLLGAAATVRPAALMAVPVWLVYLLWARRGRWVVAAGTAAVLVPVLAYSLIHLSAAGSFGLAEADGWLLYGRTASFADCKGVKPPAPTRPLCLGAKGARLPSPVDYVFTARSPAWALFGPIGTGSEDDRHRTDRLLRGFALAAIRDHPSVYTRRVARGTFILFWPGTPSTPPAELPDRRWRPQAASKLEAQFFPGYRVPLYRPAGVLLAIQRVAHTQTWLVGLGILAALALLGLAAVRFVRRGVRPRHRREAFLLVGMPLTMLVGSVAVSNSDPRFLLTGVPLFVAGGAVAIADLRGLWRLGHDPPDE